ncbi:MAG: 1-phosphofructokinase family hexose kinase [bacterium]
MKEILTLAINPAIDKSASVAQVVPDRRMRCSAPRFDPGGGGVNVSRAIRRLGGDSLAVFPVGGPMAETLTERLEIEWVRYQAIPIRGRTRQNLHLLERSTERQFRFLMPGPRLREQEWRRCLEVVVAADPRPDFIVASGSLPAGVPEDFYALLARHARELGSRLILDTQGKPLRLAVEEGLFLIKPNALELAVLGDGGEGAGRSLLEGVARRVVERGQCTAVVVSLGAAGALLVCREGQEHVPAPIVSIASRLGAGDSMVAGISLALARGSSLTEAVRFGVAAGAAAVMAPGTALCRREDTERLYAAMAARKDG